MERNSPTPPTFSVSEKGSEPSERSTPTSSSQTIRDILLNYGITSSELPIGTTKTGLVDKCLSLVGNWLFPRHCGGCRIGGTLLCEECQVKLVFKNINMCLICGGPSVQGHTHAQCLTEFTPQKFVTVFAYQPPFSKVLQRVKYKQRAFSYLKPVLKIAIDDLAERGFTFGQEALVVPIPLHFWKQLQRGFNVADIIAQELALAFNMKFDPHLLCRVKNTTTQTKLNKQERHQNVRQAFRVYKNRKEDVAGRDILLVDDVCTTGATLLSACHALKEAGAGQVWCFSLAKD